MKKNRAMVIGAVVLAVIAVGFLFGQRMSAAERTSAQENESNPRPTKGTLVVEVGPIVQAMPIGIKSTINIPPAAFVPVSKDEDFQTIPDGGYLVGTGTNPELCAPVVFPKGAKKILHVDFYVTDAVGNSAWFRMYDSNIALPGATAVLIDFKSLAHPGQVAKYSFTPTSNKIYSDHVYYISLMINGSGYFSGAIVYYSNIL